MENQPEAEPNATEVIAEEAKPAVTVDSNNSPKKLSTTGILIIALVVVCIALVAAILYSRSSTSTTSSDSEETAVATSASPTASATATATIATASPTPVAVKISTLTQGTKILPGGFADPTVVKTSTGYRMYVNTFGKGPSGYLTYTSTDATTWTKEKDIILPGVATGRAIVLPTGIRFYYPGPQPIKASDKPADMFSTFATDGLAFTKDAGTLVSPQSADYYLEGPTVFQLADKTWRMYFNENTVAAGAKRDGVIWGASSTDGATWKRDAVATITADPKIEKGTDTWKQVLHPFVIANPKGGYIMLYNSHSEGYAATSSDGVTWKKIGAIGIHGADFDGFFQADGTMRVYYGGYSETEGGLVYTGTLKVE